MTPQFDSFAAFVAMGGHAPYVWGAWGLSALVIAGLVVSVISSQRHWKTRLARMEALTAAARSGPAGDGA
jgi:heme exporter protein D